MSIRYEFWYNTGTEDRFLWETKDIRTLEQSFIRHSNSFIKCFHGEETTPFKTLNGLFDWNNYTEDFYDKQTRKNLNMKMSESLEKSSIGRYKELCQTCIWSLWGKGGNSAICKGCVSYDKHTSNCTSTMTPEKLVDNNPKTAVAATKPRLSDVPPVALYALGAAMSDGANKYGRFNYRDTTVTSSVFYDAILRHLIDWYNGEDFAHDSMVHHLGHIMAGCAILLDGMLHETLNDDRDKRKPQSISRNPTWKNK